MPPPNDTLVVRQFERLACKFDATLETLGRTREQVRLSRSAGDASGRVAGVLVDCSEGGLGLRSPVYFPKQSEMFVRVRDAVAGVIFESPVRVRRTVMVGREPTYELGLEFVGDGAEARRKLQPLLELARRQASGGGAGGRDARA